MRRHICIFVISLLLILAAGLFTNRYCRILSLDYEAMIDVMRDNIQIENWKAAREQYDSMLYSWYRVRPLINIWIDHTDTDAVTTGLAELAVCIDAQEKRESLRLLATLWESVEHLYHREALTLPNLL